MSDEVLTIYIHIFVLHPSIDGNWEITGALRLFIPSPCPLTTTISPLRAAMAAEGTITLPKLFHSYRRNSPSSLFLTSLWGSMFNIYTPATGHRSWCQTLLTWWRLSFWVRILLWDVGWQCLWWNVVLGCSLARSGGVWESGVASVGWCEAGGGSSSLIVWVDVATTYMGEPQCSQHGWGVPPFVFTM